MKESEKKEVYIGIDPGNSSIKMKARNDVEDNSKQKSKFITKLGLYYQTIRKKCSLLRNRRK